MNEEEYRKWLQAEIEHLHNCGASHLRTVPVRVFYKGKKVDPSEVEVFGLRDHATVKLAYAWGTPAARFLGHLDEFRDGIPRFVVVLGLPPVDSAQKAVEIELAESEEKLREIKKAFKKEMDEEFAKPFPSTN